MSKIGLSKISEYQEYHDIFYLLDIFDRPIFDIFQKIKISNKLYNNIF